LPPPLRFSGVRYLIELNSRQDRFIFHSVVIRHYHFSERVILSLVSYVGLSSLYIVHYRLKQKMHDLQMWVTGRWDGENNVGQETSVCGISMKGSTIDERGWELRIAASGV